LKTAFAMPGFIEGHGHFTGIGEGKLSLDLAGTSSWDDSPSAGRGCVCRGSADEPARSAAVVHGQ
jgi:hypothetical protein